MATTKFSRGKYKGETYEDVFNKDKEYMIKYIKRTNCDIETDRGKYLCHLFDNSGETKKNTYNFKNELIKTTPNFKKEEMISFLKNNFNNLEENLGC